MADEDDMPTVDGQPLDQAIHDALHRVIDPHRTPEFMERLRTRMVQDQPILDGLRVGAICWLDADERHIWFAHACNGEWIETQLVYGRPIGIKGNGGGWCAVEEDPLTVEPSVSCDDCGFHRQYIRGSF